MVRLIWGTRVVAAALGAFLFGRSPSARADQPTFPSWGLAASGGVFGGLGIGDAPSEAGAEVALWAGNNARSGSPTRALGVDAGWTTHASYAELEAALGFGASHDGEWRVGLGAGPVNERAGGGRWGAQATLWGALVPCFIFPYLRSSVTGRDDVTLTIGLMAKVVVPFYGHR
jgi:hypothetical protein